MLEKINLQNEVLKKCEAIISKNLLNEANILNLLSLIQSEMGYFWVGIYKKVSEAELQLSYFQGLPACTHIAIGKGVCGTVASTGTYKIVEDVNLIPNYIACHQETQSEIVLPIYKGNILMAVLDVDSIHKNYFNINDVKFLESFIKLISEFLI